MNKIYLTIVNNRLTITSGELREGETLATTLLISLPEHFLGYTYHLLFRVGLLVPRTTNALPAIDGVVSYLMPRPLTMMAGVLSVELQAMDPVTGQLAKSAVGNLKTTESISWSNETLPESYASWVDTLNAALKTADYQASSAADAAELAAMKADEATQSAIDAMNAVLSASGLLQANETHLGGIRAPTRTSESIPVAIDPATGNLYTSSTDLTYIHAQIAASKDWNIVHPLQKYPSVTIIDSGDSVVHGEVEYVDTSNVVLHFSAEFSGKAYLN